MSSRGRKTPTNAENAQKLDEEGQLERLARRSLWLLLLAFLTPLLLLLLQLGINAYWLSTSRTLYNELMDIKAQIIDGPKFHENIRAIVDKELGSTENKLGETDKKVEGLRSTIDEFRSTIDSMQSTLDYIKATTEYLEETWAQQFRHSNILVWFVHTANTRWDDYKKHIEHFPKDTSRRLVVYAQETAKVYCTYDSWNRQTTDQPEGTANAASSRIDWDRLYEVLDRTIKETAKTIDAQPLPPVNEEKPARFWEVYIVVPEKGIEEDSRIPSARLRENPVIKSVHLIVLRGQRGQDHGISVAPAVLDRFARLSTIYLLPHNPSVRGELLKRILLGKRVDAERIRVSMAEQGENWMENIVLHSYGAKSD